MPNHLYTNYKNKSVTSHSYSGGGTFHFCRYRYYLERLAGWREKENKASLQFGKCIESAIQFHVDNKLSGGTEDFLRRWLPFKEVKDLVYSDKEGDWSAMNVMGTSMVQLFQVWWPTMEFEDPKWQLEYKKEPFPLTVYGGLNFTAYIDLRATYKGLPLIVDIKTSARDLSVPPEMLRLDSQLADYAWVTGIPNVAFLVFVKGGTEFKKGDNATIIDTPGLTGERRSVCAVDSETEIATLLGDEEYAAYDKEAKGVKGKAADALKEKYKHAKTAILIPTSKLTKCRLQFLTTEIPADRIKEAGEIEGQNIVDIVESDRRKSWPKTGAGIRWPNDKCLFCPCRGICTGNDKLRDELLVKLGPQISNEDDWLSDLGE